MKKRVQLLLNQDVRKLGKAGDIVEVAPGYARNYLLPKQFAVHTTPGILRQVELRKQAEEERIAQLKRDAEARKTALETIGRYTVQKQAGEGDAIFGTVTDRDLAAAIELATNKPVDRHGITLPEINQTGFYKAQVKLHPEVTAEVEVQVVPL